MKTAFTLPKLVSFMALAALMGMASCTSLEVAAPPVDKLTLPKTANRGKLAQGRQILATSCVKCHAPPRIAHHSKQDWDQEILPEMTGRPSFPANRRPWCGTMC